MKSHSFICHSPFRHYLNCARTTTASVTLQFIQWPVYRRRAPVRRALDCDPRLRVYDDRSVSVFSHAGPAARNTQPADQPDQTRALIFERWLKLIFLSAFVKLSWVLTLGFLDHVMCASESSNFMALFKFTLLTYSHVLCLWCDQYQVFI